ncbi:NUDIX domain-containing protein [uncultured Lutibacter sp.]|uniref:NUDIX hydrolase n=1 Tax=uncultured Lutibacter sp. TaxID=437739 RepID=UPI0026039F98|nr:NUDIX domain-containing protein [uncultured Lutibacter sp.]
MYKVFVNDCPIFLTENNNISTNYKKVKFNLTEIKSIINDLFQKKLSGIYLICDHLENDWKQFQSLFKIQKAAGGKVLNIENEVLFIYRLNKWDLPKGKLEKGESIEQCAIREVEEECGISKLTIQNPLETTYHIFERKNKTILKITYWFLMRTSFTGELTPQTEEGIKKVIFKNKVAVNAALHNTYENIKLLF